MEYGRAVQTMFSPTNMRRVFPFRRDRRDVCMYVCILRLAGYYHRINCHDVTRRLQSNSRSSNQCIYILLRSNIHTGSRFTHYDRYPVGI